MFSHGQFIGQKRSMYGAALWMWLSLFSGCSDEQNDAVSSQDSAGDILPLQPTLRFPIGSTFYLPGSGWTVSDAPESNANIIFDGPEGFSRFTPVVGGEYRFEKVDGSTQTLVVVNDSPYEHYNYYPTSSVTRVGDEIWVAHVFDPHISRIDPKTGEVVGTIATGPWPVAIAWVEGMDVALVAQKAGDTLGIIDLSTHQLVDAVWVGDEPADVVVSPDGEWAYVSLTTDDAVARVSVSDRVRHSVVETNSTPTSLDLSVDGSTLYVASYRSAIGERSDGSYDEKADLYDIAVVDTSAFKVSGYIESVGSNINGILVDGDVLHVATTRMSPAINNNLDPNNPGFTHTVATYDLSTREEVTSADIGRQESSSGFAVRPFGLVRLDDTLWVVSEGSDLLLGLEASDLSEQVRYDVPGRPRALLHNEGSLYVHGVKSYNVNVVNPINGEQERIELGGDPRPMTVAAGQYLYTGTGDFGGANHSCNECHVDALSDGNLHRVGVFDYKAVSRTFFWMEGTHPIGTEGDGADLNSYVFGVPGPTIGMNIDDDIQEYFYAYLAALVPPPAANGKTRLDGSMTESALRGKAVFENEAGCVSCHVGPLRTDQRQYSLVGRESPTDVPSLIGAYRHAFWLLDGSARDLGTAVDAMLEISGRTLDEGQRDDVVRYLQELTTRDFFLLDSKPLRHQKNAMTFGPDAPIRLTLSHAVLDSEVNLSALALRDSEGQSVDISVVASARHLVVTPATDLEYSTQYTLLIPKGFEAFNESKFKQDTELKFETAPAPELKLEGEYLMTIMRPGLDVQTQRYNYDVLIAAESALVAEPTPFGARVKATFNDRLTTEYDVVVEGTTSRWPPLIMPTSDNLFGKTYPANAELVDDDGDGVVDRGEGTLFYRSPGLEAEDVVWTLARPVDQEEAVCGMAEGSHEVTLQMGDGNLPVVSWEDDIDALGYYVTEPSGQPPLGPGVVSNGDAYWVLQTPDFPNGFRGPISYGVAPENSLDVSEANGSIIGGVELPETGCIKLTIDFADFSRTVITYVP